MEIEKVVQSKFEEIVSSGFIEEKIKKTLEKTISDLVEESLRSYSDFGKELKTKITEAIKIDNLQLSLPEYNQLVSNWITDMVKDVIMIDSKKQVEENIKEFFKPLEKDEYTVSEIIEKFKESIRSDDERCEGEISFFVSQDRTGLVSDYVHFYFDEISNKSQYSCDYSFGINKDGLWTMNIKGEDVKKIKNHNFYNFDSFMFQLYASKVKIINDSENVDTYFSNYD